MDSPGEYLQEVWGQLSGEFQWRWTSRTCGLPSPSFSPFEKRSVSKVKASWPNVLIRAARTVFQACQVLDLASWPLNRDDLGAYGERRSLSFWTTWRTILHLAEKISQERIDARGSLVVEWRDLKADYCSVNGFKEVVSHIVRYKQRFPLLNHILQVVSVLPTSSTCCDKGRCSLQKGAQK